MTDVVTFIEDFLEGSAFPYGTQRIALKRHWWSRKRRVLVLDFLEAFSKREPEPAFLTSARWRWEDEENWRETSFSELPGFARLFAYDLCLAWEKHNELDTARRAPH